MLNNAQLLAQHFLSHAVETQAERERLHEETSGFLRSIATSDPMARERLEAFLAEHDRAVVESAKAVDALALTFLNAAGE
jgi:hypothetical protein